MVGANDGNEPVGTLPQRVRRDFSGVGYGEAMRRAREIVPILRERARQTSGRVAIANSDAGGDAYAHLAIEQAARAVRELLG